MGADKGSDKLTGVVDIGSPLLWAERPASAKRFEQGVHRAAKNFFPENRHKHVSLVGIQSNSEAFMSRSDSPSGTNREVVVKLELLCHEALNDAPSLSQPSSQGFS